MRSARSISKSRAGNSSSSTARADRERRRCCAPSRASSGPTAARSSSAARRLFVPAEERGIGMVFQSYAIWPHLTVFENVALPLTQGKKRPGRERVRERQCDIFKDRE